MPHIQPVELGIVAVARIELLDVLEARALPTLPRRLRIV